MPLTGKRLDGHPGWRAMRSRPRRSYGVRVQIDAPRHLIYGYLYWTRTSSPIFVSPARKAGQNPRLINCTSARLRLRPLHFNDTKDPELFDSASFPVLATLIPGRVREALVIVHGRSYQRPLDERMR